MRRSFRKYGAQRIAVVDETIDHVCRIRAIGAEFFPERRLVDARVDADDAHRAELNRRELEVGHLIGEDRHADLVQRRTRNPGRDRERHEPMQRLDIFLSPLVPA